MQPMLGKIKKYMKDTAATVGRGIDTALTNIEAVEMGPERPDETDPTLLENKKLKKPTRTIRQYLREEQNRYRNIGNPGDQ